MPFIYLSLIKAYMETDTCATDTCATDTCETDTCATDTNKTINVLKQYIRALSVNIDKEQLPSNLNLIFDSGAVNGIIAIGAALYIHHLEEMNYFKIRKVSGCSIGSVIALWYCYGCPEELYPFIEKLFAYYKREKNFYIYEEVINDIVHLLVKNEDMTAINDRLYINYYDTKKCKQKVVKRFKNVQHLIRCILRSSHVPFITSSAYKYQGRYIDGIVPYIFADTGATDTCATGSGATDTCATDTCATGSGATKNLFIKLIYLTNPLQCMCAKTDLNIYSRLLKGVVGVNEFITNRSSSRAICSYINDKSYLIHSQLYLRKYFILFFIFLIDCLITIKNNIPLAVINAAKESMVYNKCVSLSNQCWFLIQNKLV